MDKSQKIEIRKIKRVPAVSHGEGSRVFARLAKSCSQIRLSLGALFVQLSRVCKNLS